MIINCPQCSTYVTMASPSASIRCHFCGLSFEPTALDRRRFGRERRRESLRAARAPLDLFGAVAVFAITAAVLLVSSGLLAPGQKPPVAEGWLLPFWVAALVIGSWTARHFDRERSLVLLPRATLTVLFVLALPVLYSLLPHPVVRSADPGPLPATLVASTTEHP
jgi:hypothetical protein